MAVLRNLAGVPSPPSTPLAVLRGVAGVDPIGCSSELGRGELLEHVVSQFVACPWLCANDVVADVSASCFLWLVSSVESLVHAKDGDDIER